MSWQAATWVILALVLLGGFVWFERSRPSARIVAAVAALAALGVAGRLVLAPIPNVVATTDVALLAGYTLGGAPGFAVGALSGLVSNFWLGQGPWTPWQMAGWGLVGVAGAVLAGVSRRRLGRWGLAGVGAVMGLAYGALLDLSVMVNYGGEQSLDRYLALSARGIPFNVAHAAGNAVLMLAAGPALVRMMDRYRDRFDVTWRDAPLARAAAAVAVAACVCLPLFGAPPGTAAARPEAAGVLAAEDWLIAAQNSDGGFGTEPGAESSPGMTGWAMLGLEAAGTNPRDVSTGGASPVEYLRTNAAGIDSTADLERTILALDGAGLDPRDFAGSDLVAELADRQGRDGSYERQVNLTAFAILAQRAAGVKANSFGKAAAWLRSLQNRNGGWGSVEGAESEPDSTGAVLQALAVAPGGSGGAADGARWLERSQNGDGGWSLAAGAPSNAQSTAWAIQGLTAAGSDPAGVRDGGRSGLDYLAARQASDGHYAYSSTSEQTPVWVTAQGLTGATREPFPIAPVERSRDSAAGGGGGRSDGSGAGAGDPGGSGSGGDGGIGGGASAETSGAGAGGSGPDQRGGATASGGRGGGEGRALAAPSIAEIAEPAVLAQAQSAAAAEADVDGDDSSSPAPLLLGILGVLAAGLAAGFLRYRRRLP